MEHERAVLDALLRHDLCSFIMKTFGTVDGSRLYKHNWHIELLANYLEKAFRREIKRLIITLPPRSLKSICASVAFPAFALGHDPSLRIVCASYSADLSGKHARDCRTVMEAMWYRRLFPRTRINRKKNAEDEFETTAKGYRLSTSVGGTLTGRGGNIIIIDDAIKPHDALSETKRLGVNQWFDGTLYSRLDNKQDDVIILIMQRVHEDDLVAHVLENEGWTHLRLPAIADEHERFDLGDGRIFVRAPGEALHPDYESLETLEKIRNRLGSFFFNAQYQQTPVPVGGNMVRWEWFKNYDEVPAKDGYGEGPTRARGC